MIINKLKHVAHRIGDYVLDRSFIIESDIKEFFCFRESRFVFPDRTGFTDFVDACYGCFGTGAEQVQYINL